MKKNNMNMLQQHIAGLRRLKVSKRPEAESLIPREALNCGKDLCDDDDNSNLNGLEDHLKRDLKLWDPMAGSL